MTRTLAVLALSLSAGLAHAAEPAASPSPAPASPKFDPQALAIVDAMKGAADGIHDYTMTLVKRELGFHGMEPQETIAIKWQRPQRIYLHALKGPHEGQEVLYAPGWNKNKIKVHPGSFPDITLNLNPYGRLAMAHSHHPVPEVSLVRFVDLVAGNVAKAHERGVGSLRLVGRETVFGRPCVHIEATTVPTGTSPTLKKRQTLWDIARETGQSMYVILHANSYRHWRYADDPNPGDAVIVPDFYAGRMELWVDDALHLPIQADLFDQDGRLYEHYEHRDLKIDVGLTDKDFDPKNKAYKF